MSFNNINIDEFFFFFKASINLEKKVRNKKHTKKKGHTMIMINCFSMFCHVKSM